jgi:hypothetical protein
MVKENPFPAGDYELLGPWAKLVSKRGQPDEFVNYEAGDIVSLDAAEAERLAGGEVPVAQKPGERERQRAEALQAQADAARLQAEQAQARAKAAQTDASQAAKQSSR